MTLNNDLKGKNLKNIFKLNCVIILFTTIIINLNFDYINLSYVKIPLMVITILIIPGFSLINLIYKENNFSIIETVCYSFGISLAFTAGMVYIINSISIPNSIMYAYYLISLFTILINIYLILQKNRTNNITQDYSKISIYNVILTKNGHSFLQGINLD